MRTSSEKWPRLHLEEETATPADLCSWLRGFIAFKGRSGRFECGGTDIVIHPRMEGSYLVTAVDAGKTGPFLRIFRVHSNAVTTIFMKERVPRDTDGFHGWYVTSLLAVHLKICFRKREAREARAA